jgi:hypothetical protein
MINLLQKRVPPGQGGPFPVWATTPENRFDANQKTETGGDRIA